MREGIKRTPMELLRAVIEERDSAECDALHEVHGDKSPNDCNGRRCSDCVTEGFRKAADLVEAELDALKARALPDGMEWPCYEDGEPVKFGSKYVDDNGGIRTVTHIELTCGGIAMLRCYGLNELKLSRGERVKRPERKDSRPDGCCHPGSYECDELAFRDQNSGEDVYADKCLVPELRRLRESGIRTLGSCCGHGTTRPNIVVAPECEGAMRRQGYEGRRNKFGVLEFAAKSSCPERKVLDADGVPIKKGDTVYVAPFDDPLTVRGFAADGRVLMDYHNDDSLGYKPSKLTHEQPDTWERIEEDKGLNPFDYCKKVGHKLWTFDNAEEFKASDLVRRAKKLAERGQ